MASDEALVNLDELVKTYVRSGEMPDIKKKLKEIPEKDLLIKIDWDRVKFEYEEAKFPELPDDLAKFSNCRVLNTQDFVNDTCVEQVHSYKTTRRKLAACEKSYKQGYTVRNDVGVRLRIPSKVLEMHAGLSEELSLMETDSFRDEEEMSWEVVSQIRVPPKHRTIAELNLTERQYCVHFEIESRIKGRVTVDYKNLKTGQMLSSGSTNIATVISYAIEKELVKKDQFEIVDDVVVRTTFEGMCKFSKGKGDIKLIERPLATEECDK